MFVTIGKLSYDKFNIVGKGSFGIVYGGFFEGVKPAAIKRIHQTFITYKSELEKEAEIMLTASDHPNILRYFCYEMDSDFMYAKSLHFCTAIFG